MARQQAWVASQRLADPLAHAALEHMLGHLATLDAENAAIDGQLKRVAASEPWAEPVRSLCSFRGIATRTAPGLLAGIDDFRRFASPRELTSDLGLTPIEYSSGNQHHRGQITEAGNTHESSNWPMRSRLASLVRRSSRPDTAMRSRPAHLRVTRCRCRRADRPTPAHPPS